MKTAVDWLEEELKLNLKKVILEGNSKLIESLFEQAKEMEKEQKKCYHPLTERKYTSDYYFECTICGDNNY
jgi:hypothetical protein